MVGYNEICEAIYNHFAAVEGLPDIYWPNVAKSVPEDLHLRINVLPAQTNSRGLSGLDYQSGIIQISIYSPQGTGQSESVSAVADVLDSLPRFTKLSVGTGDQYVRIDLSGWPAPAIVADGWYITPVSIPFNCIS